MSWLKNLFSGRKRIPANDKSPSKEEAPPEKILIDHPVEDIRPVKIPMEMSILDMEYRELWYLAQKAVERAGRRIGTQCGIQEINAYMDCLTELFDFKNIMMSSIKSGKKVCDAAFNLFKQGLVSLASCIQCLSKGTLEDFITIARCLLNEFNKTVLPLAQNIDDGKTVSKSIDFWVFETKDIRCVFPCGEEAIYRQMVEASMRPLIQLINNFRCK